MIRMLADVFTLAMGGQTQRPANKAPEKFTR